MSSFRYRDHDSSTASTVATVLLGAVAGFAVGMIVAQRVGGFGGLTKRFRRSGGEESSDRLYMGHRDEEYDEIEAEDEYAAEDAYEDAEDREPEGSEIPLIEERVLEAFNNDPILAERAVDIGAVGRGIIELAGWVETDEEAEHAMTVARGVPGVARVVNRLMISDEERRPDDVARRFRNAPDDIGAIPAERPKRGTKVRGGAPKADEAEPAP